MTAFETAFSSQSTNESVHSEPTNWVYVHPDQLNPEKLTDMLSENVSGTIGFLFIESSHRWKTLPFHKKRIIFEMSAMRHAALTLIRQGYNVCYMITDYPFDICLKTVLTSGKGPENGIVTGVHELSSTDIPLQFHAMLPASLDERIALQRLQPGSIHLYENTFFLADTQDYSPKIAPGYRMEYFYRDMRKKYDLLMEPDGQPAGGDWNYDKDNRKALPKKITLPKYPNFTPDSITQAVIDIVQQRFPDHFGSSDNFTMAVTRQDVARLADHFFECGLPDFGPFEDAMAKGEAHVFHSGLSTYMNVGLIEPLDLCKRAEQAWHDGHAPLNSVEGFIRQIIGWREFVRVYYEAMMPEVREANALNFKRGLPAVYWTANSGMACMDDIVGGVKELGWSHHIPRLMVLSNFSNLTESDPFQLYLWFWYGYSDAHDWVVLPNVLGMSTFADGGVLASKPYVSGGNYINKMSNYCSTCRYKIKEKTGPEACPFNYLYWNFVDNHREVFNENGRVSFMVNMFDKRKPEEKQAIKDSANTFIEGLPRWENIPYTPE